MALLTWEYELKSCADTAVSSAILRRRCGDLVAAKTFKPMLSSAEAVPTFLPPCVGGTYKLYASNVPEAFEAGLDLVI